MRTTQTLWLAMLATWAFGCTGNIGGKAGPSSSQDANLPGSASGARRLSSLEYSKTVEALLGPESLDAGTDLSEFDIGLFRNDYRFQNAGSTEVTRFETITRNNIVDALSNQLVRDRIVPCQPQSISDTVCLAQFVRTFGLKALRRPLDDVEVDQYVSHFSPLAAAAETAGASSYANAFYESVEAIVRAMMQEPEFLYRIEQRRQVDGELVLSDYEIAARLSYFLTGTTPNDNLLESARLGLLTNANTRAEAVRDLMTSQSYREQMHSFHGYWLGYAYLPHQDPQLRADMLGETRQLLEQYLFADGRNYTEIFTAPESFVTANLANHYNETIAVQGGDGARVPAGAAGGSWIQYGDTGRQGLLSHGTFLSSFGKFSDTSPTQRGLGIRLRLMCSPVGSPPANVNADVPPEAEPGACKSETYRAHAVTGTCYNCHQQMDPIGLGLENYDNAGRYRVHEEGRPDCPIDGEGATPDGTAFNGPKELAEELLASGDLQDCMVQHLYQLANGRELTFDERRGLESMSRDLTTLDTLITNIATHDAFVTLKEDE